MSGIASIFALPLPSPVMVALVFVAAYLLVGIPLHFLAGAEARDLWATWTGLFAALIYMVVFTDFYAEAHDVTTRQPARCTTRTLRIRGSATAASRSQKLSWPVICRWLRRVADALWRILLRVYRVIVGQL